jgi:hypothetical protein
MMLAERLSKRIGEHPSTFYPLPATAASPPFRLSDYPLSVSTLSRRSRVARRRIALHSPARHAVVAQREGGPLNSAFRPFSQAIQPLIELRVYGGSSLS